MSFRNDVREVLRGELQGLLNTVEQVQERDDSTDGGGLGYEIRNSVDALSIVLGAHLASDRGRALDDLVGRLPEPDPQDEPETGFLDDDDGLDDDEFDDDDGSWVDDDEPEVAYQNPHGNDPNQQPGFADNANTQTPDRFVPNQAGFTDQQQQQGGFLDTVGSR